MKEILSSLKIKTKFKDPINRDQDISSSGQKFELPKKSNFCPLELLSSIFFSVHIEGEELQQWQATHFKACSESGRMTLKLNFYCLPK